MMCVFILLYNWDMTGNRECIKATIKQKLDASRLLNQGIPVQRGAEEVGVFVGAVFNWLKTNDELYAHTV